MSANPAAYLPVEVPPIPRINSPDMPSVISGDAAKVLALLAPMLSHSEWSAIDFKAIGRILGMNSDRLDAAMATLDFEGILDTALRPLECAIPTDDHARHECAKQHSVYRLWADRAMIEGFHVDFMSATQCLHVAESVLGYTSEQIAHVKSQVVAPCLPCFMRDEKGVVVKPAAPARRGRPRSTVARAPKKSPISDGVASITPSVFAIMMAMAPAKGPVTGADLVRGAMTLPPGVGAKTLTNRVTVALCTTMLKKGLVSKEQGGYVLVATAKFKMGKGRDASYEYPFWAEGEEHTVGELVAECAMRFAAERLS